MQKYTKIYLSYFGYCETDFINCECCNNKAVDIHHIETRKRRKDLENDINNLMALCRDCHIKYGDKKQFKEYLNEVHKNKLETIKR
ncbi:MAG TPA: HNH endonuclease [Chitinophagales bacterium]|nr:HNH endonuclease [Chitinophagales bacterium]